MASPPVWPADLLEPDVDLGHRHCQDFFDDELFSMRDVRQTLASLRASAQVGPNLRVAVDGGYRRDARQRVIEAGPLEGHDSTLQNWASSLFGTDPFYVVINELEVFNPELATRFVQFLWPLVRSQQDWFGGLSFALIIGRRGFTTFGIHSDPDCRWNLQFHLGPAPKEMFVWPDDSLDGASAAELLVVEPLLSRALTYRLVARDLFVLPCREQHAARYSDLAATLVVSMRPESERLLIEGAVRNILDNRAGRIPWRELPLGRPILDAELVESSHLDAPALALAVEGERQRRWSNLGLEPRVGARLPNPTEMMGQTVSAVAPFPICMQVLPGSRRRFAARGHTLTLPDDETAVALVERLGSGESLEVNADLGPAALMLLAFLIGHGALESGERKVGSDPSGEES